MISTKAKKPMNESATWSSDISIAKFSSLKLLLQRHTKFAGYFLNHDWFYYPLPPFIHIHIVDDAKANGDKL